MRVITGKSWGGATLGADGKIKAGKRKPANASMARKWVKSKKPKAISRAQAKGLQRP